MAAQRDPPAERSCFQGLREALADHSSDDRIRAGYEEEETLIREVLRTHASRNTHVSEILEFSESRVHIGHGLYPGDPRLHRPVHISAGRGRHTGDDRSAYSWVKRPEVNSFIRLARTHKLRVYSSAKGLEYQLERAAGRKELRDDVNEAEYESEHGASGSRWARKRQARNGDYGGRACPYGWGVDTGPGRSVCMNPKAPRWIVSTRTGRCSVVSGT
jgi:hypothetical protein